MTLNPELRRITAPVQEPVTLDEAKQFMRIAYSAEDDLITTLITAARQAAEDFLNASFILQRWQFSVQGEVSECILLPRGPVISLISVERSDDYGQTFMLLPLADFLVETDGESLRASVACGSLLRITYDAGYALDATSVSAQLKQALLRHIAVLFDTRAEQRAIDISGIYADLREVSL
jgi:uncharacterized phiE125 gp8 family phage protein